MSVCPLAAQVQNPAPAGGAQSQTTPPAPAPPAPASPAPGAPAPAPSATTQPDYPERRTFSLGVFYWLTTNSSQPDIKDGHSATDYGVLDNIGKPGQTPGVFASFPITRTGILVFDGWEAKGSGNQTATVNEVVLSAPINAGDYLATNWQVKSARLYLDDLFYPYKFPLAKLRFKTLLGIQWFNVRGSVDEPFYDAANSGQTTFPAIMTNNIIYPLVGLGMEYNFTDRLLFRADASGFGFYHRADFWNAEATLSYRLNHVEIIAGGKATHFKTSPQNQQFLIGTLSGAYFGLRWHF